jgi:hypothetical protein
MRLLLKAAGAALILATASATAVAAPAHAADRVVIWAPTDGSAVTPSTSTEIRFNASAGAQLNVDCKYSGRSPWGKLTPPSGAWEQLSCGRNSDGHRSKALELPVLSETGVYVITLGEQVDATFWITALDNRVIRPAADGSTTSVTSDGAPRNAVVGFTARAGEHIYVNCQSAQWMLKTRLFGPDHKEVNAGSSGSRYCHQYNPGAGAPVDAYDAVVDAVMPASGEYWLILDYELFYDDVSKVRLYRVPADLAGQLAGDGTPVTLDLAPAQNGTVGFTLPDTGRTLLYCHQTSSAPVAYVNVDLRGPDGKTIAWDACSSGADQPLMDPWRSYGAWATLKPGPYTLVVDPYDRDPARVTLRLAWSADVTADAVVGGPAAIVQTDVGQNARVRIAVDGTAPVTVTPSCTGPSGSVNGQLILRAPDGRWITDTNCLWARPFGAGNFTTAGTYTVQLVPYTPDRISLKVEAATAAAAG